MRRKMIFRRPERKVVITAHENLYNKMEGIRKMYAEAGMNLSQVQLTNIIAQRMRPINKINVLGIKNEKKNKSRPY